MSFSAADASPLPSRRGIHEWAAVFLLLFGGLVCGLGWIAGLVLLWSSSAWRTRDKWIGTLVWPGGLGAALFFAAVFLATGAGSVCPGGTGMATHCTGGLGLGGTGIVLAAVIVFVLAPIGTAIHLARQADQPRLGARRLTPACGDRSGRYIPAQLALAA